MAATLALAAWHHPALAEARPGSEPLSPIATISLRRAANVTTVTLTNNAVIHFRVMNAPAVVLSACSGWPDAQHPPTSPWPMIATAWTTAPDDNNPTPLAPGTPGLRVMATPDGLRLRATIPIPADSPDSPGSPGSPDATDATTLAAQITTKVTDLAGAIADRLARPMIDAELFVKAQATALLLRERMAQQPERSAARLLTQSLRPGRFNSDPAAFEHLTLAHAQALLHAALADPDHPPALELAICGPFDLDKVLGPVCEAIGSITIRRAAAAASTQFPDLPDGMHAPLQRTIDTVGPHPDRGMAIVAWPGPPANNLPRFRSALAACRLLQTRIKAALNSAGLNVRAVSVVVLPARLGEAGMVIATAQINGDQPAVRRAREIVAGTVESTAGLGRQPNAVTQSEADEVGDLLAKEAGDRLASAEYWAALLSASVQSALDPDQLASAAQAYERITPDSMIEAIRRWLNADSSVSVAVLPNPAAVTTGPQSANAVTETPANTKPAEATPAQPARNTAQPRDALESQPREKSPPSPPR